MGIASAMMDYAFSLTRKMGNEQVELGVVEENNRAKNI